jgi:hypothetical protein
MKCLSRQHENPATAKFCEECAAPLTSACPSCGCQVSPDGQVLPRVCPPPGGQEAPRPDPRADDGGGARIRGHRQPGHGRRTIDVGSDLVSPRLQALRCHKGHGQQSRHADRQGPEGYVGALVEGGLAGTTAEQDRTQHRLKVAEGHGTDDTARHREPGVAIANANLGEHRAGTGARDVPAPSRLSSVPRISRHVLEDAAITYPARYLPDPGSSSGSARSSSLSHRIAWARYGTTKSPSADAPVD